MFVFIDFLVLTSGRYTCQRACQTFALSRNYHTHIKTRTETAYLVVIVFTEANDTRRAFDILSQCTPTKYHILTACKAFMYMTSLDYDSTNDCSAIIRRHRGRFQERGDIIVVHNGQYLSELLLYNKQHQNEMLS